jgi:hypothetical protein
VFSLPLVGTFGVAANCVEESFDLNVIVASRRRSRPRGRLSPVVSCMSMCSASRSYVEVGKSHTIQHSGSSSSFLYGMVLLLLVSTFFRTIRLFIGCAGTYPNQSGLFLFYQWLYQSRTASPMNTLLLVFIPTWR